MAPSRRKSKASAAAAVRRQWKVGDLVLAKVKGFPAWPATVSEPEKWGYSADWKKVLVYFFGTKQIAFCNHADVEAFTEDKKDSLLGKRQGKGADYVRAVKEIIESFEKSKKQDTVDDLNADDEVIRTHVGNSEDSLPGSKLRDQTETSLGTFISQRDVTSPTTDVVTNASHERDTLSDEPTDNAATAEANVATIYLSREISESIQPSSVKQKRSRSSSRSRNSKIPSNDGGKNFKGMGSHLLMDRTLRRNKQIKRPADALEIRSACSPVLVCNDSIEDNSSEIVTVESDTTSFNEGSTLEFGSNFEHVESVECLEEGAELGEKLEFPIKAVVMKKKRKQKRNRVRSDAPAPEHTGLPDKVPDKEREPRTSNHDLSKIPGIVCERLTKEDGDEHLPLVKRARVRMGKQCVLGEKADSVTKIEDDSSKEVPIGGPVYPSLNCGDNSVNIISVMAKEDAVNSSPSNTCFHFSDNKPFGSESRKNQSFISLDGEATLPPSKRLHRALEAMSANVAEDGTLVTNGSCNSPVNKYKEMKSENDSGAHYTDSHGHNPAENHTSQIYIDVNPCTLKVNKLSPVDADNWIQPVISSNSSDEFQSPSIVPAVMKHQFFPGLDGRPAISRCNNQDILVQFSPKNEKQCANLESSHHKAKFQADVAHSSESTEMNTDHLSEADTNKKVPHQNDMTGHCHSNEVTFSDKTECLKIPCDDKSQIDAMCEIVNEDNNNKLFKNTEKASTTILDEKNLSRAAPISDDCPSEKDANDVQLKPSPADAPFLPEQSPSSYTSLRRTTNTLLQNNGCSSSKDQIHGNINKTVHTMYIDEEKSESAVTSVGKSNHDDDADADADADVCLTSFETTLAALTRTKESIGRATRIAIDCFKYGTTSKVVDILLRYLENEPSLPKRVDLFFLVDSITQCSRGFKGDVRGMFPSAIQSVLPRLLAAAAPSGNTARENRRQCLKVLRLWLDRRIFPESIVRQHMRHLDSLNWSASAGTLSRRPQRNERAFDDPLREMEGMLVDEYGSNSSFQIPGFSMPHTVKVEEDNGIDSDGGSFEAVTPEHNSETPEEREPTPTARKHRHILEDVDGELEMEDVSPSSEAVMCDVHEVNNTSHIPNHEQHIPSSSLTPQLPEYLPLLSPPPLPTSPPPPPPPLPPPALVPGTCANGGEANLFVGTNNMQRNLQPVTQHEDVLRNNPVIPDPLNYHAAERQNFQMETRLRDSTATCSVGNYPVSHVPMGPVTNVPHTDGEVLYNKAYHLPPPPSTSSSQFSYAHHTDRRVQSWRDPPFPDYNSRHHYPPNNDGGHYYTDHDRSITREFNERWRYPGPSFSGPVHPRDRASYPSAPDPYLQGGPSRIRNQGWNYPPQETNYRRSMPREAPRYWPPR